ncbi:MAG: hypothetical protein R2911_27515 [Caldilineaceae bacterium]
MLQHHCVAVTQQYDRLIRQLTRTDGDASVGEAQVREAQALRRMMGQALGVALVTGATGAVGPALVQALVQRAMRCAHWCGGPPPGLLPAHVELMQGDLDDPRRRRRGGGGRQAGLSPGRPAARQRASVRPGGGLSAH